MFTLAQLSHPQRLTVAQLSYSPDVHCRTAEPPPGAHFGNLRHPQISIPFHMSVLHLFYVCLSVFVCKWYKMCTHRASWMGGGQRTLCMSLLPSFLFPPWGENPGVWTQVTRGEGKTFTLWVIMLAFPPLLMMSKVFIQHQNQLVLCWHRKSNLDSSLHHHCWVPMASQGTDVYKISHVYICVFSFYFFFKWSYEVHDFFLLKLLP